MKSFCIRKSVKILRLVLLSVLMNGMTKNALCLPNREVNFCTENANIPNIVVKLPSRETHTIMLTARDLEGNTIGTGTQITVDHDIDEFILYFTLSGGATGWTITKTSNWIYFPEGVEVHSSVSNTNNGGAVFSLIEIYNNMTITSRTDVLSITTTGESGIPTTVTFTIIQEGSVSLIPPTIDSVTSSEITLMGDVDGGYTAEVGADDLVSYFRVDILDNSASGWSVEEWEDDKNLLDISENTGISGEFFRVDILPNGTLEEKQATLRVVTTGESDDPDTVDIEIRQSAGGPHNVNVSASIFDIPTSRCVDAAIGTADSLTVAHNIEGVCLNFTLGGVATGWEITKSAHWINFPGGIETFSNMGNGFVTLTLDKNSATVSRMNVLNIVTTGDVGMSTAATFTVRQLGLPPTISGVSTEEVTLTGDVEMGHSVSVDSGALDITFTIDILDNTASGWILLENTDFLSVSGNTSGVDGESFELSISPNNTLFIRSDTLSIVTMGGEGVPDTVEIKIEQRAGISHTLLIASHPSNRSELSYHSLSLRLEGIVLGGGAESWTVSSSSDWITNLSPSLLSDKLLITLSRNEGSMREGMITFVTMGVLGVPITIDFMITQSRLPPVITDIILSDSLILENSSIGTVIGTFTTIDPEDTQDSTYIYMVNNDTFTITNDTLKTNRELDFEGKNIYTIQITTNDGKGEIFTKEFDIKVGDINEKPTNVILSDSLILENSSIGTVIGTLRTIDPDDPTHDSTYIYMVNNDTFTIEKDTLKTNRELDFEGKDVYTIQITTNDGKGRDFTKSFDIKVGDINEKPTNVILSDSLILENSSIGTAIGTLRTIDPDDPTQDSTYIYMVNNDTFIIEKDTLKTNRELDFEGKDVYTIQITTNDGKGRDFTKSFDIKVEDINEKPTDITLSDSLILENSSIGTAIGTLRTIDPDDPTHDSTYIYMVNNDTFIIEKDTLKTNRELDFEGKNIYTIQITTNDGKGEIFTKEFDIKVGDINEKPTDIILSDSTILENSSIGTAIGTLRTIDPDDPTQDSTYIYMVNNDTFIIEKDTLKTNRELDFEGKDVYTIQITTNDGKGRDFTKSFDIKVEDINEKPTDITLSDSLILENSSIGTIIGTLHTIDPDDPTHDSTYTYMVNNDTFIIEKDTLKTNRELDFEEKDVYTIQITTNDGKGEIFTKEFDIKVGDINEKPTDIILSDSTILENSSIGTIIGTLHTIDPDDPTQDSTYIYMVNNDTFIIEKDTLKTNKELDFEGKNIYTIQITTNDGKGEIFTKEFDIKVGDINEKPTNVILSDSLILENSSIGTIIGTLHTIDPDDPTHDSTYIHMINNDTFTIDNDTLKTNRELDFEEKQVYTIQITTNDGKGRDFTKEFDIKVGDINEKPTDIILSDSTISENLSVGTTIGTLRTIDPDDPTQDSTYIYVVNNDTFTIDNDRLKTNRELDFEEKQVYTIQITTNDSKGGSFTKEFDIKVGDINEKPTDITLSDSTISENLSVGTTIGTLHTIDPDDPTQDSTYIYVVNNDTFIIEKDTLKTNRELDFEEKQVYTIQITTNDGKGEIFTKEFDIKVGDINEKPTNVILSDSLILENSSIGTAIGTLHTIDPDDPTQDSTYIYVVNNDTFRIEKDTLKTNRELDFEGKNIYTIQITTNDGKGGSFTKEFDIKVEDINEKPTDIILSDSIISENLSVGTTIGTLRTIDPDDPTHDSTYIYMANNDTFIIEKDTLKTNRELDFEGKNIYTIQITTNDGKGGSFTKEFDIKVEDINEKPTDITLSDSLILENSSIGTTIGTLRTIDPDDPTQDSTYIYMVNNDTFRIEKDTLKTNRKLDFGEKQVYTIQITTNDGKGRDFTKGFTIIITNEDEEENTLSIDGLLESVEILPVVVEDAFTLKMDHSFKGEVQLRFYTLNGTIVKAGYYHKSSRLLSKSIEVSHLTGGIYVVIIHFDNFTITRKIVKK